jgi:hypothetical protein
VPAAALIVYIRCVILLRHSFLSYFGDVHPLQHQQPCRQAPGTMEVQTTKLQNLNITTDETDDDAKALQHLHLTSDVETESDAIFERDYIVDDDDDYDDDYDDD